METGIPVTVKSLTVERGDGVKLGLGVTESEPQLQLNLELDYYGPPGASENFLKH